MQRYLISYEFNDGEDQETGGIESGNPSRLLDWEGPSFAGAICYELSNGKAIAKAVNQGAKWILVIANLDPYPIS